jgi:hypothetical protein
MELADFPADDGKNKAAQWFGQRQGSRSRSAEEGERRLL